MKHIIILILTILVSLPAILAFPSLPIEVWGTINTNLPVSIRVNGQTYDDSITQDGYYRVLIENDIELGTEATVLVSNNITSNIILNDYSVRHDIKTLEIQLRSGWNLISIPSKEPKEISEIDCPIAGNGWEWDNSRYIGASKITFPRGIWIFTTSQCTTINNYDTEITQIPITSGWNLVGVPFETTLKDFIGDCTILGAPWYWDSTLNMYQTVYDKYHESDPDRHIMKPGVSYWILGNSTCTLSKTVSRSSRILESDISPGSGFGSTRTTTEVVEETVIEDVAEETIIEEVSEPSGCCCNLDLKTMNPSYSATQCFDETHGRGYFEDISCQEIQCPFEEDVTEKLNIEELPIEVIMIQEETIFTTNVKDEDYDDKSSWISINDIRYDFEKAKDCTQTDRCLVDECLDEKPCKLTETSSGFAVIDYGLSDRLILCQPCTNNKFSQIYYKNNR